MKSLQNWQECNVVWKSISGYESLYEVSNKGDVRSLDRYCNRGRLLKSKILRPTIVGDGYKQVSLFKEGIRKHHLVHHLVADHFLLEKRHNRELVVDHIDNNKLNNHYTNLQIVTQRTNNSKDRNGTSIYTGVSLETSSKKWRSEIRINGKNKFLGRFETELKAHIAYENELSKL